MTPGKCLIMERLPETIFEKTVKFLCTTSIHCALLDLHPVCHNNGTVEEMDGTWICACSVQFTGPYCETGEHLTK